MSDPGSLLATLAQSSAAIVAIVGGFLVSRLVQLSSEREGLRRQLVRARDGLKHVATEYDAAYAYRFENSKSAFFGWVLEDLVKTSPGDLDVEFLLEQNIPRGSSIEEMRGYLSELMDRVSAAKMNIAEYIDRAADDDGLTLDDLTGRGLQFDESESEIYELLVDHVAALLPEEKLPFGRLGLANLRMPRITSVAVQSTEMRRLDESIRDEQNLQSRKLVLEAEISRLVSELDGIGRPAGVVSAILILSVYSVLGIVLPVSVMAIDMPLEVWSAWLLVGLFTIGLVAVLGYIWWYARTLSRPFRKDDERPEPDS